jgi:hypothetical protein
MATGVELGNQGNGKGGKTILTFDHVQLGEGQETGPISDYGGLDWRGTGLYNTTEPVDQYGYGQPVSGENIGFSGKGYGQGPVTATSTDGDFNFFGARFTGTSAQTVTATSYDDGKMVGELTFEVTPGSSKYVDFTSEADDARFASIDKLVFDSDGFIGLDDFTLIG